MAPANLSASRNCPTATSNSSRTCRRVLNAYATTIQSNVEPLEMHVALHMLSWGAPPDDLRMRGNLGMTEPDVRYMDVGDATTSAITTTGPACSNIQPPAAMDGQAWDLGMGGGELRSPLWARVWQGDLT